MIEPWGPATAESSTARNTLVLPEHKIMFVQVTKNACTSIKLLLAEISGQDLSRFPRALSDEGSRRMLVHNRWLWKGVPRLSELPASHRAEISPDNGWFVFAIVRDPRLRAWSAWQSKFLVGDPVFTHRRYTDAEWLPRVPQGADDVLQDWRTFVDVLADGRGPAANSHFRPQIDRLRESEIPYSNIYDIRELSQMTADLGAHLDRQGVPHGDLELSRENDTPLKAGREVFADGILEKLNNVYASDLARFGQLWNMDATLEKSISWDAAALRDIAQRVALGERIADLYAIARNERGRRRELETTLATAAAETEGPGPSDPMAAVPAAELVREVGRRTRRFATRGRPWRRR